MSGKWWTRSKLWRRCDPSAAEALEDASVSHDYDMPQEPTECQALIEERESGDEPTKHGKELIPCDFCGESFCELCTEVHFYPCMGDYYEESHR